MDTQNQDQELELVAKKLRHRLSLPLEVPDHKSRHQVQEEIILEELRDICQWCGPKDKIHAFGRTPEEAIETLALVQGWGKISSVRGLEGRDPRYTWGRTFLADGVSMKAAGWSIPGGVVLAWWK